MSLRNACVIEWQPISIPVSASSRACACDRNPGRSRKSTVR